MSGEDTADYPRSRALRALGLETFPRRMHFEFFNVGIRGELAAGFQGFGAGARAGIVQALQLTTGGDGVGRLLACTTNAATAPKPVPAVPAQKFWLGAYYALGQTAIAAGQSIGLCLTDLTTSPEQLCVGVHGASSTVNFGVFGDLGGFTDSGVPIDRALHFHEYWRDGAAGSLRVDGRDAIPTSVRASVDATVGMVTRAAAPAAAVKTVDVRWFAIAMEIP